MRKIYVTMISAFVALSVQAQTWVEQLEALNPDVIDSVRISSDPNDRYDVGLKSYYIYYHQPLQHDVDNSQQFPLRALLTVHDDVKQPQLSLTQTFFSGYTIYENVWTYPNFHAFLLQNESNEEIATRYQGNFLQLEHRYFAASAPDEPWTTLGYCTGKEAAADFHAIIQAMKKVFTGKWVVSGISKGGITAAMQQAFYPEDADFFVSYVAPFCDGQADQRMQERWMSDQTWTPEMHAAILHIQHEMANRPAVYEMFKYRQTQSADSIRALFLSKMANFDFALHVYSTRDEINKLLAQNNKMINSLGYKDYTDEMLLYFLVEAKTQLDNDYLEWYKENFVTRSRQAFNIKRIVRRPDVFGITEDDWNINGKYNGYCYQVGSELGFYDTRDFSYFFDNQEDIDAANAVWNKMGNLYQMIFPMFRSVNYDSSLRNFVLSQTKNAVKPVTFIYGGDDMWTGAAMDDDCINGINVHKYILDAQNHDASILAADAAIRDEIFSYMDQVLGTPTTIQGVTNHSPVSTAGAAIYNMQGQRVTVMKKGQIYLVNGKKVMSF